MNAPIVLTKEERERFAAYLEQEAATGRGLVEQMGKLPGTAMVAKVYAAKAEAQQLVAKDLRSIQEY